MEPYEVDLSDPVDFSEKILGVKTLWSKQIDVARAVAAGKRVTVRSGNGVGKTKVAACIAIWFYATHDPVRIMTTAPTQYQVKDLLWGEIREMFPRYQEWEYGWQAIRGKPLKDVEHEVLRVEIRRGETKQMMGRSSDEPINIMGKHCENMLIIVDEASGFPQDQYDALLGLMTSENNRLLLIGNPMAPEGYFYESHLPGSPFSRLSISCLDSPNVKAGRIICPGLTTKEWVDERALEWGKNSMQYIVRVLGEFPSSSEDTMIPLDWVEGALTRGLGWNGQAPEIDKASLRLGCDVARFGSDNTVIMIVDKHGIRYMEERSGADTMETAGRVAHLLDTWKLLAETAAIDDTGVGGGVTDRLREMGYGVEPVNFGRTADDRWTYANARVELWGNMRDALNPQKGAIFAIPPEFKLVGPQLTQPHYKMTSTQQIRLEPKEDIKKRLGRSPDHGDALALCFAPMAASMRIETL